MEEASAPKTGMVLNLAMNYGGRAEIAHAARALAQRVKDGALEPGDITEEMLSGALFTAGQPDPDLIIRRGAALKLPSVAERLCRVRVFRHPLARF